MGNETTWNDRCKIGVKSIDKAHERLFSMVRKLADFSGDEKKERWACEEGVKFFKSYTLKHFSDEEEYMRSIDYKGYDVHKRLHDTFRDRTLPALENDLEEAEYSPESIQHFLGICLGWISGHIMFEDRAISGRVINRWNELLPKDEIAALEKVIIQCMEEMFDVNTRVVSEHYMGEDFGKRFFYRMRYCSPKGKQLDFFIIFEERLLLQLIGDLMGIEFKKMDDLVIDTTKQLSKQLVIRMGMYFRSLSQYVLEKENILSNEQLLQEFDSGYPQCSLLLDTGNGYFAFCIKQR